MSDSQAAAASPPPSERPKSFAALRHPGCRFYLVFFAFGMCADNIEHVISYYVIFEKFQSPALGGFAVISHWLPFLLFSIWSGALADRMDPRRVIQIGLVMFIAVSLGWGVLFFTDSLQQWHAMVLLVIHGMAGVFWGPAGQLMLHHIVGGSNLQSAIRLFATSRVLGIMMGPAIGGGLMLLVGPAWAISINALIYMPLMLWLWKAPYGPKFAKDGAAAVRGRAVKGFRDVLDTFKDIATSPTIISMTLLVGASSFFVGNAHQAQMPEFAFDLGHGEGSIGYSVLFGANAAGALLAGFILESGGLLQAKPRTAFILMILWCFAIIGFAATASFEVAVALLLISGFLNLAWGSMAQTLIQINAPAAIRGRVIGIFNMSQNGLRAFSGITVGVAGEWIGIHWSLGISAIALLLTTMGLMAYSMRGHPVPSASGAE